MRRTPISRRGFVAASAAVPATLAGLPAFASPQSPTSMQPPDPDLGNIFGLLDWIGSENKPGLSFLAPRWKSLEEWKKAARPLFRRHLSYSPKPAPLSAEMLGREEREGFTLEKVRIRATAAYDIPGWVLVPAGRKGRVPGVVALHCHSARYVWGHEKILSHPNDPLVLTEFRSRVYGRPFAEVLARRGYVVLVIDAFYFGERRLRPELMDPARAHIDTAEAFRGLEGRQPGTADWLQAVNTLCGRFEHLTAKTIFGAGATWPGILAWDDMRSVDYLCSRPEVDPQRIGCLGLSIGGLRTAYLIAADPRIKAACVTGWMTEFRAQLRNHFRSHTWMVFMPGLYPSLDLPDAAALIVPGALLVQQCSQDRLYPLLGMKGAVDRLARIFAKAGIPERFRGTFYDVPHSFGPEMQDEAFAWLDRWLRPTR